MISLTGLFFLALCGTIVIIIMLARLQTPSRFLKKDTTYSPAYQAVELRSFDEEEIAETAKCTDD